MSGLRLWIADAHDEGAVSAQDWTPQVIRLRWRLGFTDADQAVAPIGEAEAELHDPYIAHPDRLAAWQALLGRRVQIRRGQTPLFTGYVWSIEPSLGRWASGRAVLRARDVLAALDAAPLEAPPLRQARADDWIAHVLAHTRRLPPVLQGRWLLGRARLRQDARLARLRQAQTQTGISRLGLLDGCDALRVLEAIARVVEAEGGRFFVDEGGALRFLNRHAALRPTALRATLDEAWEAAEWQEQPVVGRVQVRLRPRSSGTQAQIIWRMAQPLSLGPGETRRVLAYFLTPEGQPLSVEGLQTPRRGQDYQAISLGHPQHAAQLEAVLSAISPSSAAIDWRNNSASRVVVQAGATLRATPIQQGAPLVVEETALDAEARYSAHTLLLNLPALDDVEQARARARYLLARLRQPRALLRSIRLTTPQHAALLTSARLMDALRLRLHQPTHDRRYLLIGVEAQAEAGRWWATWRLAPLEEKRFWALGQARLRQDSTLAY
ncbi:MAG: hypothetical protein NZ750_08900 [Anaerolineae bacterium]|nr:hypothetical protein [Anaerolineae bacterium]MDW8171735.1 hypothetical protein [Anaerolineae bacterium]